MYHSVPPSCTTIFYVGPEKTDDIIPCGLQAAELGETWLSS